MIRVILHQKKVCRMNPSEAGTGCPGCTATLMDVHTPIGLERAFEEHLYKGSSISNMGSVAIPWDYGGMIWRPSLPPISAQFSGGHVFKPRQKFF